MASRLAISILTLDILTHGVETVPYLLYLSRVRSFKFDRDGSIEHLKVRIKKYFKDYPEIVIEWNKYHEQFLEEKDRFGYEKTTIIDVWNNLEKRYSGGKIKRRFFNSFYMTNPAIFFIIKKLLQTGAFRFDKKINKDYT